MEVSRTSPGSDCRETEEGVGDERREETTDPDVDREGSTSRMRRPVPESGPTEIGVGGATGALVGRIRGAEGDAEGTESGRVLREGREVAEVRGGGGGGGG